MAHMQGPAPPHEGKRVWVNVAEEAIKVQEAIDTELTGSERYAKGEELRHFQIRKPVERVNEVDLSLRKRRRMT